MRVFSAIFTSATEYNYKLLVCALVPKEAGAIEQMVRDLESSLSALLHLVAIPSEVTHSCSICIRNGIDSLTSVYYTRSTSRARRAARCCMLLCSLTSSRTTAPRRPRRSARPRRIVVRCVCSRARRAARRQPQPIARPGAWASCTTRACSTRRA